ncbi:hypothetical protein BDR03DRAFT_1019594 [Suillus americanus]|nr:hypothetical protein BDR03DRAFT_1019594 [Suillus americanus]
MDTGVCSGFMIFRAVLKIYHRYFPSGYVLAGDASIPYWAITDPGSWTYATFNIQDANATYQKNSSSITPSASSSSSGSSPSPSSSSSSSGSKSTDVGAIVGGTIGGAAALSFLAIVAYLLYRRHVYRKGARASAINPQGMTFMPLSGTHNRIPSDTSNFVPSMSGPLALYGQSVSPSQQHETAYSSQPQTAYPSLQGSFSPLSRTDVSYGISHSLYLDMSDVPAFGTLYLLSPDQSPSRFYLFFYDRQCGDQGISYSAFYQYVIYAVVPAVL